MILICRKFLKSSTIAVLLSYALSSFANHDESKFKRIDDLFLEQTEGMSPGYAIGVTHAGKLIYAKGYGYADIENKKKIDENTAFNLASLSKQFTAAAIAILIERDVVFLGDYLHEHWEELPGFMSGINLSHLIYMTSGLPEYYNLKSPKGGWGSEDRFTVEDAMEAVFKAGRLEFKPGTQWAYSNINYQLLAELVSRKSEHVFSRFCSENFFKPLSMQNSWVDFPIDENRANRAVSYVRETKRISADKWVVAPRLSPHYGGSGMFSSLKDLAKWDRALYVEKEFGESFYELMLSTKKFRHDKTNDAFGLVHGDYNGQPTIWYAGGDYGVSTYMVRLPLYDETIICLSNYGSGRCNEKVNDILNILYDKNKMVTDKAL